VASPATEGRIGSRIPSLDGLRAIAVALVCLGHLTWNQRYLGRDGQYLKLGDLGVRIFFVLSGYLITGILLRELESTSTISLRRFYFRRTLRIFPAFYTFVIVMVVVNAVHWVHIFNGSAFPSLSYTADYVLPGKRVFGHTWSLAVEEQFYLLWPAGLLLLGRRRALWLAGLMLLVCPLMREISFALAANHADVVSHIQDPRFRFDTQADALAMGCLLSGLRMRLHGFGWYRHLLSSRAFVLVPFLGLTVTEIGNQQSQLPVVVNLLAGYAVTDLAIALSLDWCLDHPSGRVGRFLNAAPMAAVGAMSYSIYLWQEPFLYIDRSGWWHTPPANIALTLLAATTSYLVIERPSLRLRSKWEQRLFSRKPATERPALPLRLPRVPASPLTLCRTLSGSVGRM
jgi:peptidoglycan/LPS O-acetylase OafA/YrhL